VTASASVKRVLPLPIPLSLMQNSFFQGRADPMPRKRDLAYILTSNHDSSDENTHPSVIEESGIGGEHLVCAWFQGLSRDGQLTGQNSKARLDPASRSSSVSPGRRRRHALSKPTTSTPNLRSRSNKRTPPRPPNLRELRSRYCADIPTTLDPSLRLLLQLLMEEPFYSNDQLEPVLGCPESQSLLIKSGTEGLANDPKLVGKSIYWLFIDEEKKQCRICGTRKTSQGRVISCIRSNLDHRPFGCRGAEGGCNRCVQESGYVTTIYSMTGCCLT
jgi:hypothetical protein